MKKNDVFGMWKSPASRRNVILLILSGLHETVIGRNETIQIQDNNGNRAGIIPRGCRFFYAVGVQYE
ncbi:MAG: hypothetical protein LBN71_03155 [Tannerella sp.]|jgi:hypothetical protein|nr:hypothetical protein [Tannerella sp.]